MKETKIEKLILNLSNRWDCSPQEAVDRLNSMNESEINKLINSMTKKFQVGGTLPKAKFENGGVMKCLKGGKTYSECMKCGGKTNIRKGIAGFDTKEVVPDLSRYRFYGRDWYTNDDGSSYSVETVATKRDDLPANWNTNPEAQQNMGEFDPDIMQRYIENGDTTLFRGNYFVPKGGVDWKKSNAVIDSLGVRAGVKKKQMGGELKKNNSKVGDSKKLVNHEKEWGKTQKMETQKMETPPKDKKKTFVKLEHLKNVQNTKPIKPLNYKK